MRPALVAHLPSVARAAMMPARTGTASLHVHTATLLVGMHRASAREASHSLAERGAYVQCVFPIALLVCNIAVPVVLIRDGRQLGAQFLLSSDMACK